MQKMKVYIYNVNTLGRNPYLIEDLSTIIERSADLGRTEFLEA